MKFLNEITAETKLAAVIGSPLNHSKSPAIYNAAFEKEKLNAVYLAFETSEEETEKRIRSLQNLDVLGINITMPGKKRALNCVDSLDPAAEYVQSINTITKEEGSWKGYNTDGAGFWSAVKRAGVSLPGKRVALFGSGNTSRVILAQAVLEGCTHIDVIARNLERPLEIKTLISRLQQDYPETVIELVDLAEDSLVKTLVGKADIVAQTTSAGMAPNEEQSLVKEADWFNPESIVFDAVYNPRQTKFLKMAESRGCRTIGGIMMLIHQAALNFHLFTGKEMDLDEITNLLT